MRWGAGPLAVFLRPQDRGKPSWLRGKVSAYWRDECFLHVEWSRASWLAATLTVGGEDGVDVHLAAVGQLFVSLPAARRSWVVRKLAPRGPREIGLRVFSGAIWWDVWVDPHGWRHGTGRRSGSFDVVDAVLGRTQHAAVERVYRDQIVVLPEGNYPCDVTLTHTTITRPRVPWRKRVLHTFNAHMDPPLPTQANDHIRAMSRPLPPDDFTVGRALAEITATVLEERERREGRGWAPPRRAP